MKKENSYIRSDINLLSKGERRKLADFIMEQTKLKLGRRRNLKLPKMEIRKGGDNFGYYNESTNVIRIHWEKCVTVGEFARTIIHEYTHYLQPVKSQYIKLYKKWGYHEHPFEIEARENEKKLGPPLLKKFRDSLAD